ncbi:MAG: DUF4296 domain-containing protein [Chitinophagaceae bacterium]|nr:DUF4296 domain-containing protein [Chitinophagaceae bacterium]
MRIVASCLLLALLIASCSDKEKVPNGVMARAKMQEVLWDMISAGEFLNGYVMTKDSIDKLAESSKVYAQVFQVHRVTREEFDKSYRYYREHPKEMRVILDSLSKKKSTPVPAVPERPDSLQKRIKQKYS